MNKLTDDAVVLLVKNWQTADKYAVCFTREHGKVRFIAYGARYPKNTAGRILQPFANLRIEISSGQKIDRLRSCELLGIPAVLDFKEMAYGAVISEITAVLTEDHEPQEEIYHLLNHAFPLLKKHNPRILTAAFAAQLLEHVGIAPAIDGCVVCGQLLADEDDCYFSALQGGCICHDCHTGGEEPFAADTRRLFRQLQELDFAEPRPFSVRGGSLMELEKLLLKFIVFQTGKPLKSLEFLNKLQV